MRTRSFLVGVIIINVTAKLLECANCAFIGPFDQREPIKGLRFSIIHCAFKIPFYNSGITSVPVLFDIPYQNLAASIPVSYTHLQGKLNMPPDCATCPAALFPDFFLRQVLEVIPVSYTHLDVYKRQGLYSGKSVKSDSL